MGKSAKQLKGKRRRQKRKRATIIVLAVAFGYFILRGIPSLVSNNASTETVVKESYVDEVQTQALIVKEEHVQTISTQKLKYAVKSGEKIAKGQKISAATVTASDKQKEEIDEVANKATKMKELLENYSYYISLDGVAEKDIEEYLTSLGEVLGESQASKVEEVKKDILSKKDNNSKFFEEKIKSLEDEKKKMEEEIGLGKKEYTADKPGIFSTKVDGLESKLTPEKAEKIKSSEFDSLVEQFEKSSEKKEEPESKTKIKIVDNTSWYVLLKLDKDYKRFLDEKNAVNINIPQIDLDATGSIVSSRTEGEDLMLLLEFDESLHEVYDMRYVDVNVEKETYTGLKVPSSSITEKDGNKGVYIKDITGVVKFVPIRVMYKGTDYSIVNEEESGVIKIKKDGKLVDANGLQVYDEVFKRSFLVKENQIIN